MKTLVGYFIGTAGEQTVFPMARIFYFFVVLRLSVTCTISVEVYVQQGGDTAAFANGANGQGGLVNMWIPCIYI